VDIFKLDEKETILPVFETFEAEISIVEIDQIPLLVTAGLECLYYTHSLVETCSIEKILSEIKDGQESKGKVIKFLKPNCRAKVVIKLKNKMYGDKSEKNNVFGKFLLYDIKMSK